MDVNDCASSKRLVAVAADGAHPCHMVDPPVAAQHACNPWPACGAMQMVPRFLKRSGCSMPLSSPRPLNRILPQQ